MIHSYPFYFADWRGSEAVLGMTLEEKGLYRELLDDRWASGSLPVDESLLRKICRASSREWKRSWAKVSLQFNLIDGRLHHPKVDEKRSQLVAWHDNRQECGRLGGLTKWQKLRSSSANGSASSSALADGYPSSTTTTSSTITPQETPKTRRARLKLEMSSEQRVWFHEFLALHPKRQVQGASAETLWAEKVKERPCFDFLMERLRIECAGDTTYLLGPWKWLRDHLALYSNGVHSIDGPKAQPRLMF